MTKLNRLEGRWSRHSGDWDPKDPGSPRASNGRRGAHAPTVFLLPAPGGA